MTTYTGIGLMSGTSLDGLDLCCVEFTGDLNMDLWSYRIVQASTVHYTDSWRDRLDRADTLSGVDLIQLHVEYGHFLGKTVSDFIAEHDLSSSIDFVSSHGHTVFHQPDKGFTFQLGEGETTSSYLRVPFICNLRSKDVALGGQGAPLVPCGEQFLFNSSDICINLGGIANIGVKGQIGYDICPCNMILNRLAMHSDKKMPFDKDGALASKGKLLSDVFEKLESLSFYRQQPPKSLGREWVEENMDSILDTQKHSVPDLLRTMTEHIAARIHAECEKGKRHLGSRPEYSALLTGGGAFNKYLVDNIRTNLKRLGINLDTVDDETVNFKEALIFAFLGLRCLLGEENICCDVTGARMNSVSGSIHRPLQICPLSPSVSNRKFNFALK